MKGLQRLSIIRSLSEKDKNWKHRDLFRILNHNDLWITAYETLKGNKGSLTPGSTSLTMDGMSINRLNRLRAKVMDESYRFNPVKRTYIKRPDGKLRPLGMPTANDKIVQEVLRMILEAVYEPCFSKTSFGFRPGLGCHDALDHIERKFRWVDYVIEGDVEQAYPSINHAVLVNTCLRKRIEDERFLNLVWKCLKCGVLDNNTYTKSVTGIPQGSIIGPILANIYYNELDEWVEAKMIEIDQPVSSRKSPAYISIERKIGRRAKRLSTLCRESNEYKNLVKEIKELRKLRLTIPSLAEPRIKIEYVRYADDWMIGIAGDKTLSSKIKLEVSKFIQNELKQSINPIKTRITNLRKGTATFLGYHIYLPETKSLHKYKGAKSTTQISYRLTPF
jgi:group II intron reverse transcriptase/maturase